MTKHSITDRLNTLLTPDISMNMIKVQETMRLRTRNRECRILSSATIYADMISKSNGAMWYISVVGDDANSGFAISDVSTSSGIVWLRFMRTDTNIRSSHTKRA